MSMNEEKMPYLVQRVIVRDTRNESNKGLDQFFSFDYMGSAEFEFGTLPAAVKRQRASKDQIKEPRKIKIGERVCWYLGTENDYEAAKAFFVDQLTECKVYLKERTDIQRAYNVVPSFSVSDVSAWLVVDEKHPTPWVLFKKKDAAKQWLKCL